MVLAADFPFPQYLNALDSTFGFGVLLFKLLQRAMRLQQRDGVRSQVERIPGPSHSFFHQRFFLFSFYMLRFYINMFKIISIGKNKFGNQWFMYKRQNCLA